LVREHANVPEYQGDLAWSYGGLGLVYLDRGRLDEAEAAFREALDRREQLATANPTVSAYQWDWAMSHPHLRLVYQQQPGRAAKAEASYLAAIGILEKLAGRHGEVDAYQNLLAGCHHNLGYLYAQTGKPDQAQAAYRRALSIREQLVAKNSEREDRTDLGFAAELGSTYGNLGTLVN